MTATQSRRSILVEVEEALGPGLDYDRDLERGGIVLKGARGGGLWLGADRAFLVDSDDGHGRAVPVLVALSASSFVGARIDAELVGGVQAMTAERTMTSPLATASAVARRSGVRSQA